ncbi:DoxX family protein [Emticicia sp. TH156]|uniref:DoxX family protein n=1 Tax=Emticicia sp. TH156 TaxID=2067454 RepID=UPI000C791B2D|nr:DoxX family protein [Emticicia sp. TH156]PLK43223.1 DoxX family protein [Emticicia sp. TH156]
MINNSSTFLLLRLAVGMSMFGHGFVRVFKLAKFSEWMLGKYENSLLPAALVKPFSYALPIIELVIGVLIIIGLFTRQALLVGGITMVILIFGSCMIEDWGGIPSQMIHTFFFALLLSNLNHNSYAVDSASKKQ